MSCASHSNDEVEDHDEDHHSHSGITLSPEKITEFGIEFEEISPSRFHDVIKTSGNIEASGTDIQTITAKKSGIITLIPGLNMGVALKTGEKIGSISTEGIQGGDVSQAALANLEAAKAEYERLYALHKDGLVTTSTFREAERAYKEAQALSGKKVGSGASILSSPGDGNVQNLYVRSGEYVEVGDPIASIAKTSNLILRADIPVRESKHLAEIESANFIPEGSSEVLKISEMNGKMISRNFSPSNNGYIPVYFSFTGNPLSSPGGFAEVFLICRERNNVISVPRSALIEIQGNKYLYIVEDDGDFEKRLVKTGSSDGERIEILEGLSQGEKIVSKGASIIRMSEVSSIAPPSHTHNH